VQYTIHNNNNNSKGKKYLRHKFNILTNEKKKKGSFYPSIHSPGSDDDGLTRKKEQKEKK